MPIFEYECKKCGKISSILCRKNKKNTIWAQIFRHSEATCNYCGCKELTRIFSTFSVSSSQSTADMLNDISKMGPVNFVPDYRPKGPPPGGCPYAQQQTPVQENPKKIDKIKLS